jgi:hypothetical protein
VGVFDHVGHELDRICLSPEIIEMTQEDDPTSFHPEISEEQDETTEESSIGTMERTTNPVLCERPTTSSRSRGYPTVEKFDGVLRELIQDLRELLAPNDQPREWGQIAICQRVTSNLELILNEPRTAQRWP